MRLNLSIGRLKSTLWWFIRDSYLRTHWEYFPCGRKVPKAVIRELQDTLIYATGGNYLSSSFHVVFFDCVPDTVTGEGSIGPYDAGTLETLTGLVRMLERVAKEERRQPETCHPNSESDNVFSDNGAWLIGEARTI